MSNTSFKLSFGQFVLVIYKTQVGIGVLTLPHDLYVVGGIDGWISILIGWFLSILSSYFVLKALQKHPDESLFDILPKYFGKWIGRMILIGWLIYTLFAATVLFMYTVHIAKVWILPNTSPLILGLLFLIPIYQITTNGLPMISRYAELTFLITIWMVPVLLYSMQNGLWINLLPVARDGWAPILKAVPLTSLSFMGFEIAYILYPHLKKKKDAFKGVVIANSMSALIFLTVSILSYIRLSEPELKLSIWPTLDLLKLIRFPFLERLEIIFNSAYIIILFMSVIPYLYMALDGANHIYKRLQERWSLIIVLSLWAVALFFPIITYVPINHIKEWYSHAGLVFAFLFPFIFWLYSKFFLALRKGKIPQ
jgi:spore germination protein (amino acid permease)